MKRRGAVVNAIQLIAMLRQSHEDLMRMASEALKEAGGCDHAVGVCWCGEQRTLEYAAAVQKEADAYTERMAKVPSVQLAAKVLGLCVDEVPGKSYLIWSIEHGMWWRPNACGYTKDIREAGVYLDARARQIVDQANRFTPTMDQPNEALVPLTEWVRERRRS